MGRGSDTKQRGTEMKDVQPPIRLLHVDDDPMFLDLTGAFLERSDQQFDVDTANSPDEALTQLGESTYDVIVSDHDMPEQTGIDLLSLVRETHPNIPFVLFTGKGSEEIASDAIAAGVSDYLQKGSTDRLRLLANRVANLVSQYRAETSLERYAEQQRIVSELGQIALTDDLDTLFEACVTKVSDGLDVEYCKVLMRQGEELLLRTGVGWKPGLVGQATVGIGMDSQAGYTLVSDQPVVVTDLTTEDRFRGPPLLTDHAVVSGISVVVGSPDDPWGVLGAHTTAHRQFTDDDVTFVRSVASVLSAAIDRTEYRETIELQREQLTLFIEESPLGIVQYDESFEIVSANPAAEEILGYDEVELVGETWEMLVSKDSYDDVAAVVEALAVNSGGYRSVDENIRKNGQRILCEWHNRVVTDDAGDVVSVFSLFQDVTERERRQQEMATQADLFEKAQNLASVGAWEWVIGTDDGFWTSQVACIHGLDPDNDGGTVKESLERYHPEDKPIIERAFRRATEDGEPYDLELRIVQPSGEQRWVRTRGEPQYEGDDLVRIRGTIQDVTDRKERELELVETVDLLQQLYEVTTAAQSSFETKLERIVELGCEVTELSYGFLTDIERSDEDSGVQRISYASADHELLQTGNTCPLEEAYCRKTIEEDDLLAVQNAVDEGWENDSAYRVFELGSYIGTKVFVENELYGTLCFASTEPREAPFSEPAKILVKLMGKWVGYELERDLSQSSLAQKNERLREFTSVVSHDLRSPLSVAMGHLELARERSEAVDATHLDAVADAHAQIETIIKELLALARGGSEVKTVRVSLAKMATDAWDAVETEGVQLAIETKQSVWANPPQLRQLLRNLFQNAVEHGGDGVTVTMGELATADGFYVADDGVGIHSDESTTVFDEGYSTSETGMGLGLSIVRDIANRHGWTIALAKSENGGVRIEAHEVKCADRAVH